jgi:general secretion pathway protein G
MEPFPDNRGFTVIELMVVIGIIGIIAGIAVMALGKYVEKAKIAEATADINTIHKAMVLLENDTGEWPGHQTSGQINKGFGNEVWDLSVPAAGLLSTDGAFPNWKGPYLASITEDPWGKDYFFDTDYEIGGVDAAVVGSFGPNEVGQNLYDDDDVIKVIH